MAVYQVSVDRLSDDVGWVLLAGPFQECEVPGPDSLLDPKLGNRQMANPADAGATADADRRAT
eukprot:9536532-Alexandrium_andersonii.AAC.1